MASRGGPARAVAPPEVGPREVDRILRGTAPSFGSYVAVTLLAIVAPHVAAFGYLLIAIVLVVRARGSGQTEGTARGA